MKMTRRNILASLLPGCLVPLWAMHAAAAESVAEYPSHAIRIIVPFGPGASNDTLARLIAAQLSQTLRQAVVVENRVGASGDIGMVAAARSKPDGYTLLVTANAVTVSTATKKKPAIDLLRDLQPLTMIGTQPMLLVAGTGLGVDTLPDFLRAARGAPEKFSFGTPGTATPQHMTFELISAASGIRMIHVPFPSTGQALNEVLANRVSLALATTSSAGPFVQQGKLKVLAVVASHRLPDYPDAPTLVEAKLGTLESGFWYGVTAPAGIPAPIAAKISGAIAAALALPSVREQIRTMDIDIQPLQGPAFGAFIAADYRRWKDVAQKSALALD